jgi:tRNA(Ile)-lysidine synthase
MVQSFKYFIDTEKLFIPEDKILLSVSGGIDSVVMTELFEKCGWNYAIAHCNFNLRGIESDDDALFVESIAKKNKVEFFMNSFNTKQFASQQKISIQMAARKLRISWFENLIDQHGYKYYATAHHQDDQIETFLINLIRGTGISGLHGILPRQERLIHPMLFTNRMNTEKFALENKIDFRIDSSNFQSDYTRNKIRHHLIPVIKEINPEYIETFTENIERFRQAEAIYSQQIQKVVSQIITKEGERVKFSIPLLSELEHVETYLYEILVPFGFHFTDVKNIIGSFQKQSGKKFFSKTHHLFIDRNLLIVEKIKIPGLEQKEYKIPFGTQGISKPLKMNFNFIDRTPGFEYSDNKNHAYLDSRKLSFPLHIRKWRRGDSFCPLGMKQKKLLSDFFVDNKISIPDKEKIWLLISGGQIAWIVGQRIDDRFKITPETQNILKIQFEE